MRRTTTAAVLAASALLALGPTATGTTTGTATGTEPLRETGRVVRAVDGDTLWACLDDHPACTGTSSDRTSVRFMAVQAMEVHHEGDQPTDQAEEGIPWVTTDQCHAREAADRVAELTRGRRVEMRSRRADSTSFGRLRRTVYLVQADGTRTDLQATLLAEGQVLWMPLPIRLGEYTHNTRYNALAQQAAAAGLGVWDDRACSPVPAPTAELALDLNWDAPGDDTVNVNGEWVRVRNTGSTAVDLDGWTVRTASWNVHTLTDLTLPPGGWVKVHTGTAPAGGPTRRHRYLGLSRPLYPRPDPTTGLGGGSYLFDTSGNIRAWQAYPCLVSCPRNPGLRITAVSPDPPGDDRKAVNGEYVRIRNVSDQALDLAPYLLQAQGQVLSFPPGTTLDAGRTLTVRAGRGTDSRSTRYWGNTRPILANAGGTVTVRTFPGTVLHCRSWRTGRC